MDTHICNGPFCLEHPNTRLDAYGIPTKNRHSSNVDIQHDTLIQ